MPASRSPRVCRSTSAILTVPGNAAPTKTPTGCCANTFPKAPTSARTTPRRLPPWRRPSTPGPERHLPGKHPQRRLTSCSDRRTNRVLRRLLESAQYLSIRYSERLLEAGIKPSVGSVGNSYDNALAETINGLFKAEVIHRRGPWRSVETVEFATLEWVDWFNNRRLLEPIGNIPPAEAEARYYAQANERVMAASLKPNSLRQTRRGSDGEAVAASEKLGS